MHVVYKEESYKIIGACFEVYREKGCGFLEPAYQACLEIEFSLAGIPCSPKPQLNLTYKGQPIKPWYEPDFVCFDKIVIEIKAVSQLADKHRAQLHNYLKATGHKLGIPINFGRYPKIEYERIVK